MPISRSIYFWITGTICIFFGAILAGKVDPYVLGASPALVAIAYIISFILILVGGMFWISIASIEE